MPLRLNVGSSKKIGEPNYGSRGASVILELELDSALVNDPDKLKERIRQLFGLVRSSLAEELNGTSNPAVSASKHTQTNDQGPAAANDSPRNQRSGDARPATGSQVKALFAIARSKQIDLGKFLMERFQVRRADDLCLKVASQAIDELKRNGQREG